MTAIDTSFGMIVRLAVPETAPEVAVMVAALFPVTPVATPPLLIVAAVVLLEDQVAVDVKSSVELSL